LRAVRSAGELVDAVAAARSGGGVDVDAMRAFLAAAFAPAVPIAPIVQAATESD
jgi:hypothetical protein